MSATIIRATCADLTLDIRTDHWGNASSLIDYRIVSTDPADEKWCRLGARCQVADFSHSTDELLAHLREAFEYPELEWEPEHLSPAQTWERYMGDQGPEEFAELGEGDPIEELERWAEEDEGGLPDAHVEALKAYLVEHDSAIEAAREAAAERAAELRAGS